jgi:hypothetical protein
MHFTTTFLLILATAALTLAGPLVRRVDDGHQSCTAKAHIYWTSYSVQIGAPYDGNVCSKIYDSLDEHNTHPQFSGPPTSWKCEDDGEGHFQLWFDMPLNMGRVGKDVSEGLSAVFPSDVINGFNCPDY